MNFSWLNPKKFFVAPAPTVQVPIQPDSRPSTRILWDAADLIEYHGWVQHVLRAGRARCVYGALMSAEKSPHMTLAYQEAVRRFTKYVGMDPASWNDTEGRTQQEVVSTLRAVALKRTFF